MTEDAELWEGEERPNPVLEAAELARQVTEHPAFKRAVREMREGFINGWISAPDGASDVKDIAHRNVRFLEVFVTTLTGYIERAAADVVGERPDLP